MKEIIVGVDEAGRGPAIGPLVVGAATCPECSDEQLLELGIRDSKRLTPLRREKLRTDMEATSWFYLEVCTAEKIDELREGLTLNQIEAALFARAVKGLLENPQGRGGEHPEKVFKDGCILRVLADAADVREEHYANEIKDSLMLLGVPGWVSEIKVIAKHKGDDIFPLVSLASIFAKTERDRAIDKIQEELGTFGSGYPSDPRTIDFLKSYIKQHGKAPPHSRTSWKTISELIRVHGKRTTLDDF